MLDLRLTYRRVSAVASLKPILNIKLFYIASFIVSRFCAFQYQLPLCTIRERPN